MKELKELVYGLESTKPLAVTNGFESVWATLLIYIIFISIAHIYKKFKEDFIMNHEWLCENIEDLAESELLENTEWDLQLIEAREFENHLIETGYYQSTRTFKKSIELEKDGELEMILKEHDMKHSEYLDYIAENGGNI